MQIFKEDLYTCMLSSLLHYFQTRPSRPNSWTVLDIYRENISRDSEQQLAREKRRDQTQEREMERGGGGGGGGFHGYQRLQLPKSTSLSSSSSGGVMLSEMSTNNVDLNSVCTVREQDRYMPIANVIRIMRKVLPTHAKISDDAKETIQECVSEYISFITSEANERCQREQRKTITAEDVLWAMSKLGFDDYIEPLTLYLQRYREFEGERSTIRGDPFMKPIYAPLGGAAFGPAFHIGHHHQGYFTTGAGGAPPQMNDYFRDGHVNQAHGQAAMAAYDPYAPYK